MAEKGGQILAEDEVKEIGEKEIAEQVEKETVETTEETVEKTVTKETERAAEADKKLSDGEIKKLKEGGEDIHELKGGKSASRYDLYKDKKGNIYVKPKGGKGPGDPLHININHY